MVQPLASRSTLTKTRLKLIIVCCWLFGFFWNVPLFSVMTYRADLQTCGEQWPGHIFPIVYSFGWSVVAGIAPISLMSYLYSRVVYKLWFEVTPAVPSTSAVSVINNNRSGVTSVWLERNSLECDEITTSYKGYLCPRIPESHCLLLGLERSIPYYTPHIRPQPGPDLPYQAPCIIKLDCR